MSDGAATFEGMYRVHAPAVHRRALELLGNRAEAAEVVQDVFTSLWERPEQFGERSAMTTFLYSATTHACLNRLRNVRTRARLLEAHASPGGAEAAPARAEHLVALRELLTLLPDDLARAAVHYYLDEMTYDEIAGAMACSRRHVATLLKRLLEWHRPENEP